MKLELQAYGKINLGLDVLRKREDGYHEVKMIMQTVKLHDTLYFESVEEDVIILSTNADGLPVNEDNLIYRACQMLKTEYKNNRRYPDFFWTNSFRLRQEWQAEAQMRRQP